MIPEFGFDKELARKISIPEFLQEADSPSLMDLDGQDHEFIGVGEDSLVYRAGDKVMKFYLGDRIQELGQERAGQVLELYRNITNRVQLYFNDNPIPVGDRLLEVRANPIDDLFWYPECSCWVSVSQHIPGFSLVGYEGEYETEEVKTRFMEIDRELGAVFKAGPISIRAENVKYKTDESGARIGLVVTDLAMLIAGLQETSGV